MEKTVKEDTPKAGDEKKCLQELTSHIAEETTAMSQKSEIVSQVGKNPDLVMTADVIKQTASNTERLTLIENTTHRSEKQPPSTVTSIPIKEDFTAEQHKLHSEVTSNFKDAAPESEVEKTVSKSAVVTEKNSSWSEMTSSLIKTASDSQNLLMTEAPSPVIEPVSESEKLPSSELIPHLKKQSTPQLRNEVLPEMVPVLKDQSRVNAQNGPSNDNMPVLVLENTACMPSSPPVLVKDTLPEDGEKAPCEIMPELENQLALQEMQACMKETTPKLTYRSPCQETTSLIKENASESEMQDGLKELTGAEPPNPPLCEKMPSLKKQNALQHGDRVLKEPDNTGSKNDSLCENVPDLSEHLPDGSELTPSVTEHMPSITEHMPGVTEHIPDSNACIDTSCQLPSDLAMPINQDTVPLVTEPTMVQNVVLHFVPPDVRATLGSERPACPAAYLYYPQADQSYKVLPISEVVIQNDEDMVPPCVENIEIKSFDTDIQKNGTRSLSSSKKRGKLSTDKKAFGILKKKKNLQNSMKAEVGKKINLQDTKELRDTKNSKKAFYKRCKNKSGQAKNKILKKSLKKSIIEHKKKLHAKVRNDADPTSECNAKKRPELEFFGSGRVRRSTKPVSYTEYTDDFDVVEEIPLEVEEGKRKRKVKTCDCCPSTKNEKNNGAARIPSKSMDSSHASFSKADKKNDTRKIKQFSCPGLLKHKCPHCPFTTLNKYYLWKSHVMRHAGALSCSLDQCNLESKFNRKIGYHKITEDLKTKHRRPRAFRCDICNKAFTFETNVVRHKKIAHVEKLQYLDCPVCHKLFLNALKLEHHMSIKHKQPFTFPSLRCKTSFTLKDMLLKHKKSTHAVKRFRDSKNFNGKLKPSLSLDSGLEPSLMVEKLKVKDFVKGESNTYWLHSGSERTVTVDDYNIQQIGCCNGTKYFSENKTEQKQKEDYTMTNSKDKIAPEKPPNKMVLPVPVVRLEKLSRLKICGSHSIHVNNMSVKEVDCNASDTIDVSECTDEQKERKFLGHKYPKYIFSQTGKVEKDTVEKTKVYSRRERKPRQLESYYVSDFVYPWSDSNSECEEDWDCGKERTKSKTVRKRKSRDIEYCMGSEDPEWEPAEGNKKRLKSMLECGVKHKKDLSKSHCGKVSSSVPKSSKSDVMQIRMSDNRKTYVTKRTGFKKVMMIKLAPSAKNAKVEEKITLVKFSNKESECKSQKADKVIVVSKMKDDINTADLFEDEQNNNTADIEKIGKTLENEQEYSQLKPLVERDNIFATLSSLRVQYQEQLSAVS